MKSRCRVEGSVCSMRLMSRSTARGHALVVRVHGGESGNEELTLRDVVEADHLDLVGHPDPGVGQTPQHSHGQGVRHAEHTVEVEPALRHRAGALRAFAHAEPVHVLDQGGIRGEVRGLECLLVAGETEAGGVDLLHRPAQDRDTSAAPLDQVAGGRPGRFQVGHGDMVDGTAEDPVAQDDHRVLHPEPLGVGLAHARGAENEPVVLVVARQGQRVQFVLPGRGLLDAHPQTAPLGGGDDAGRQPSVVGTVDLGDGETDDPCTALAQIAGGDVDPVVEPGHRVQNLLPRGRADVGMDIDDVRHGHRRDSGRLRHVLDRYHARPCSAVSAPTRMLCRASAGTTGTGLAPMSSQNWKHS